MTHVSGLRLTGGLAPMGRSAHGQADLVMEAGHVAYPGGSELLDGGDANGQAVTICRDGNVVFIRFHGLGDAALDLNAGTATIEVSESSPAGMDKVLAAGPVLAVALSLRGQPLLHASAVSVGPRAVAFAAPSGGGKTSLAALACMNGAELVADDTLALVLHNGGVQCLPGDRELRLRPSPAELLSAATWSRRTTADGRVAVLAGSEELRAPALAAIVVPSITLDRPEGVERLRGAAASQALLGCSRLVLLQVPHQPKTMFELAADLIHRVPVYRVTMSRLTRPVLPEPVRSVLAEHLGGPW